MPRARASIRRFRVHLTAAAATAGLLAYVIVAGAATPIPVPDLLVVVTTKSGNVTKTHLVPIGGAPIPIDVDGPTVTGLLEPDIDVSVGLVAIDELPGKPIVPNVVVTRDVTAVALHRPAPPVDLDARVILRDAGNGFEQIAEIHYGFTTPGGAKMPQSVAAKLVGPIEGGFVDPLQAKLAVPGYGGPLDFHVSVLTDELDAKFALGFDSMPESVFFSQQSRTDGLDASYSHTASVADVHLDAQATLIDRLTDDKQEIGANIERLPQLITLSTTKTKRDRTPARPRWPTTRALR